MLAMGVRTGNHRPMTGRRTIGLAMAALLLPVRAVAAPAVDPKVAAAVERIKAEGDTQFDFSPPPPPEPPEPQFDGGWLADFFTWLARDGNGLVQVLAYALIGLVVLAILYFTVPVVQETVDRWLRRAPKDAASDEPGWQPDHAQSRNLLAEADALAADGRYAEAAHLLLGRSLEDIANRRPGLIKPALTARAIAHVEDLPGAARDALTSIVAAVERSRWARRAIDAGDWQAARSSYETFAFGPHWRAGAT
jgi:hypothetical protein